MTIRLSIDTGSGRPTPFASAGSVVRIGRDPDCELALQGDASSAVSRQHARIELTDAGATLADLGSSNGTLLNGQLLDGPAPLRVGDRIQMGFTGATLTVLELVPAAPSAAKTAAMPRAVLIGAAAGVAGAAVLAGAIFLRRPKGPDDAPAPSTEAAVAVRPADTGRPPPPPAPVVRDNGRRPPPPVETTTVKGSPSLEVKEVGSYVALDKWVSVLLRRQGEEQPWGVLRPEERVRTAQTLVSLPGYRSLVALDSGLHLTLWGNLPEFSASPPVLESVVMLHAPAAGTDLDVTLDRGRVVIANRKANAGPARVRLRFLRASWELELPDDKSEVAVELWGLPQQGATFTCLGLFTKGRARVKTPRQELDLGHHSRVSWQNLEPDKPYQTTLPNLPVWWTTPPDHNAPDVKKALLSLLDWRDQLAGPNSGPDKRPAPAAAPVVATIKTQVEEVKDPDNQDVGILFLAALDEVPPLVDCLMDRQNSNVLRGATVSALQSWLSRGARHGADLSAILDKRGFGKDKAELIVRLLHFYAPQALGDPKTYEDLVNRLDDDNLLVRELSFWQLDQLGVGGRLPDEAKKIVYDPTWGSEQRRSAVEQWKKLVADHKLPAKSGGTSPQR